LGSFNGLVYAQVHGLQKKRDESVVNRLSNLLLAMTLRVAMTVLEKDKLLICWAAKQCSFGSFPAF